MKIPSNSYPKAGRKLFALFALFALSTSAAFAQSVSATNVGGGSVTITASNNTGTPYEWKICHKKGRLNPVPATFCIGANNVDVVSSSNPLVTTITGLSSGKWYTFAVKVHYFKQSGSNTMLWKYVGKAQIKVN